MYRYSLEQIVDVARNSSKYYKELYKNIPMTGWKYTDLPIVPYDDFVGKLSNNKSSEIFTSKPVSGFVASSSSTTGFPKICTFSKKEWKAFMDILGRKVYESGTLEDGDIIANLTMPGRMRTSYLAASYSQFFSPADCVDIPICGTEETEYIVTACKNLKPNTLAGLSFTLLNVAYYLKINNIKLDIKKIFYGGELMYGAQLNFLKEVFPNARIVSYMYGSNESGLVGYSDTSCEYNEHRVCSESCIFEIIDQNTLEPIEEENKEGIIVITNLTKLVLPAIRFPTGDKGVWIEPKEKKERKFRLNGRISEPNTTISDITFIPKSFRDLADFFVDTIPIIRLQLLVKNDIKQNKLELRICLNPSKELNLINSKQTILKKIMETYPRLQEKITKNEIEFNINFVSIEDIIPTTRSAKHKQILSIE